MQRRVFTRPGHTVRSTLRLCESPLISTAWMISGGIWSVSLLMIGLIGCQMIYISMVIRLWIRLFYPTHGSCCCWWWWWSTIDLGPLPSRHSDRIRLGLTPDALRMASSILQLLVGTCCMHRKVTERETRECYALESTWVPRYEVGPAVIYQDNLSCMELMKQSGPGSEHFHHNIIRHFWICEKVFHHEVKRTCMQTC